MSNAKSSEPAFPVIGAPGAPQDYPGLTKRELLAAMAMQGLLSDSSCSHCGLKEIAAASVMHADALLSALNTETK